MLAIYNIVCLIFIQWYIFAVHIAGCISSLSEDQSADKVIGVREREDVKKTKPLHAIRI